MKYASYVVRSPKGQDTATSVGEVISDSGHTLSTLLRHAKSLARAESILTDHTSPEMAENFQVAAMRGDRMVLLASTASWAMRLRMHTEHLLQFLQLSGYEHLRYIDIRVAPLNHEPLEKRVRRELSPAAKLALNIMSRMSISSSDDSKN